MTLSTRMTLARWALLGAGYAAALAIGSAILWAMAPRSMAWRWVLIGIYAVGLGVYFEASLRRGK